MKFIQTTLPTNPKHMVKLDVNGKETWMPCSQEVKDFSNANFKKGDDVEVTYEADGKTVSRISKPGQGGTTAAPAPAQTAAKPADASPAAAKTDYNKGTYRPAMSPEETEKVMRQSVMNSTCNAVHAVQSQLTPDELPDYLVKLYNRLLAEVKK